MAEVSNLTDFNFTLHEPDFCFPPVIQKENADNSKNLMMEMAKGVTNTLGSTITIIPNILAELREDRKQSIKDVFDTIQLMDSYGMIKINRPEVAVAQEKEISTIEVISVGAILLALIKVGVMLL